MLWRHISGCLVKSSVAPGISFFLDENCVFLSRPAPGSAAMAASWRAPFFRIRTSGERNSLAIYVVTLKKFGTAHVRVASRINWECETRDRSALETRVRPILFDASRDGTHIIVEQQRSLL